MKKLTRFCLLVLLLLAACTSVKTITNYFVLYYNPVSKNPVFKLKTPINASVEILEAKVSRTYDKNQMVVRHSAHRINYSADNMWAVRPSVAIADLVNDQINAYHLFTKARREFLEERPQWQVITQVNRIEMFKNDMAQSVHLNLDFYLRNSQTGENMVMHISDLEQNVDMNADMDIFAQVASQMLKQATDEFLVKVVLFFKPERASLDNSAPTPDNEPQQNIVPLKQ